MRVLHVIPSVAPRDGGPSHAVLAMSRALRDIGVDTLIATTDADGRERLAVQIGRTTTWEGVPAIFFRKNLSTSFKYSRGLGRWLRANVADFDAVHIHAVFSHSSVAAADACRQTGTPYIVRPLGSIARWSLSQRAGRKRVLLALGGARMLRHAGRIHYTSPGEQRDAEAVLGLPNGIVIPLGTDPALLAEPLSARHDPPYVLVLSRLHPKKNIEPLLEAFVQATVTEHREWRLRLAGDGDAHYVSRLKALAAGSTAGDRVEFIGWVDGARKRDLLRGASVFALPSLQENFGISLLEAMALGVPALVSRHVDLAAEIELARGGWVVAVDRDSIRAGLVQAMSSGAQRARCGASAREFASRFSWPSIARQLADAYHQIVTRPSLEADDACLVS